ncbi:MAG: hypothetical protein A2W25_13270 [candidate division Zixibacteria bacterium RBG_16_53_22]|nr:MAG: hypothetical protein A2W25_13270 [candidate division Zixibacteria bacterium RBG_16_53_22]
MITLDEAKCFIDNGVTSLKPALLPLLDSVGCALTCDIIAPINVPEFASSAMDGIAFKSMDLNGNGPWKLPIQETIAAGDYSRQPLKSGHAVKIMTGAPLPRGADTIMPVEYVTFVDGWAIFSRNAAGEDHVRPLGDDIKKGQILCKNGDILKPVDLGVLASLGMKDIEVIPRPRIMLLSTGSEVIEPGVQLNPGQIYDSNNVVLRALLARDSHLFNPAKRVMKDDPEIVSAELSDCLEHYDIVITTGGVSMGDFDFIPQVVRKLGGEIVFHKVAIKPGKPVLLARFGSKWLLGLPGNPVSVIAGYHLFARRVIGRLMGQACSPRGRQTVLGCDVSVHGDRLCLVGAKFQECAEGRVISFPSNRQKSNRLSSISGIDGFVFIDGGTKTVPAGSEVYAEWL